MANHYQHKYKDVYNGWEHQVDIFKPAFPTVDYVIKYGASEPVILSHSGGSKNDWDKVVIQGQDLEFNFLLPRVDADVLADIFESQYKDYKLEYRVAGTLHFVGWVKPENLYKRYEKNPPYIEVSFPATDGLADLKSVEFRQDFVTIYTGIKSLLQIVKHCVEKLDFALDFKIQLGTYESVKMTSIQCALEKTFVRAENFVRESTSELGSLVLTPIDCWSVLEHVLKPFKVKFKQYRGAYYITNYHEVSSYEFTFAYATLAQTGRTAKNLVQDATERLYKPYIEEQKIHPISSVLTVIEDTNTGIPATGLDLGLLTNYTHTFLSATQAATGEFQFRSSGTSGDTLTLINSFYVERANDSDEEHLFVYFQYRRTHYDGTVPLLLSVRLKKPNLTYTPWYSYPVNTDEWASPSPYAHSDFRIAEDGDYTVEWKLEADSGYKDWSASGLVIEIRGIKIQRIVNGVLQEFVPGGSTKTRQYRQINISGYEELEVDLMFRDGDASFISSLLFYEAPNYIATTRWNSYSEALSIKIVDMYSRLYLINRSKYKNYLTAEIIDKDFTIDYHNILEIEGINYVINSWSRRYRDGIIEATLVELITGSIGEGVYEEIVEAFPPTKSAEIEYDGVKDYEKVAFKVNHGFEIGDVIRSEEESEIDPDSPPLYFLAQADTLENATAIGVVTDIISADFFKYMSDGYINRPELFPFERGAYYYLSPTIPGKLTTEPTFEQYEIEQAIGFGTDKGFKVEIDARNLNLKAQVGALVPRLRTGWSPQFQQHGVAFFTEYAWAGVLQVQAYNASEEELYYWLHGDKNLVPTYLQADTIGQGMNYFFIEQDLGVNFLRVEQTRWDNGSADIVFMCAAYWNHEQGKALYAGFEFHHYEQDPIARGTTHATMFTEYLSGLELTMNQTDAWKLNVADGVIRDEELTARIQNIYAPFFNQNLQPLQTQKCYIDWWESDEQGWFQDITALTDIVKLDENNDVEIQANSSTGWELQPIAVGEFAAVWVLATMDWKMPIKIVIGSGVGTTEEEAIENNLPATFTELVETISFFCEEYVVLARIIVKNIADAPYYEIIDIDETVRDEFDNTKGEDGADGVDGITPHIGENGNWWIGETDTGVKAAGTDGTDGQDGLDGENAYVYVGYASDNTGTDFSLTPAEGLDYIAILSTNTEIISPIVTDFAGLWVKYVGEDGADGQDGEDATADPQTQMGRANYGYLYNWYAATDEKNIANAGWDLPALQDCYDLLTYLGGIFFTAAGGKLKETGFDYWYLPNTGATNEVGFNARGSGERVDGIFVFLNAIFRTWSSYDDGVYAFALTCWSNSDISNVMSGDYDDGLSIRLIKTSTTLTNGQTGTYTGNDGKVYKTICIGTQEWLSENLAETRFRDGTPIPGPTFTDAEWAALTTSAYCIYGDNPANGWEPGTLTETFQTIYNQLDVINQQITEINEVIEACCPAIEWDADSEGNLFWKFREDSEWTQLEVSSTDTYVTSAEVSSGALLTLTRNDAETVTAQFGTIATKNFWVGTLAQYTAISPKNANTIYHIEEE
jgi:uncharacterized protein (TIGR02145 family)